jgi:hypothetical protein
VAKKKDRLHSYTAEIEKQAGKTVIVFICGDSLIPFGFLDVT